MLKFQQGRLHLSMRHFNGLNIHSLQLDAKEIPIYIDVKLETLNNKGICILIYS